MVIKDFEERNYMKYPIHEYKYFSLFDLKKEQQNKQNIVDTRKDTTLNPTEPRTQPNLG